ncbi:MAG: class I SAM-dependent rRNA methyltransferase [candidate division WOR-3 bacterium]|nr:class I SAM-dependent rRNA methyltransferase [candidate division WOR-3 bacterium]MCR4423768.1 class I SAM-dependent rRNA methyltransferase [candidate division WOR-3 bacterium]MDH7519107.1 class I SAM-dependent rRNA methyltransferase [bacterium]
MPTKTVYAARKRNRADHLWIYSNEIIRTEDNPAMGDLVKVFDRGRFIGCGMFNPRSLIAVRLYSTGDEELDEHLLRRRLEQAYQLRKKKLPGENDFRLVFGESDWLPGLVIDKYGSHYAIQVYAAGFDNRLDLVTRALLELFDVTAIFEKDDIKLREPEGLERRERLLYGTPEPDLVISENGLRFYVNISEGQKTGYFFDHRLTRLKVRKLAKNRRVLDVFCYTGSFAINAAWGGAKEVKAVDISAAACALAERNARLNGVAEKCEFVVADAFEYMRDLLRKGERFELINLDPPAFIKAQKQKKSGINGYLKLNRLALKLLTPGGILVSSSCSHYLFWQDLLDVIARAAQETNRTFVILDRSQQGPDHPVLPQMPESEYLRCLIVQVD